MRARKGLLVPLSAALALSGAAVATSQDGGHGNTIAPPQHRAPHAGAAASAPGAASLAALRRPQRDDDRPSAGEANLVGDVANVGQARRVRPSVGSSGIVAPGADATVCFARDGYAGCPSAALLEERGAAPAVGFRGNVKQGTVVFTVSGLAADGVEAVTVVLDDGGTIDVPVRDNAFLLKTRDVPSEVRWEGPGGADSETLPVPEDLKARLRD